MSQRDRVDPERLRDFSRTTFGYMNGAVTAALIYLGDALGLYRSLAVGGPATAEQLAERSGLHERWVREWLYNQAAARLVEHEEGVFALSPEGVAILADEDHPAFAGGTFSQMPGMMRVLGPLQESFRTGLGLSYDELGPEGAAGVERGFAPWVKTFLVPVGVPAVPDLEERLTSGAVVADVGCGAGAALIQLATAFPASQFHGYELSRYALDRAAENLETSGVANAQFHHIEEEPLPEDGRFDAVLTFDCLHDMAHPGAVMGGIRKAIREDGIWWIADIKSHGSYEANAAENPMASMMYGFSVLTCMSSAMSEPGGLGLGTLGFHEAKAREMTEAAGFSRFERVEIDHPVNAFYAVRP
jgi:2-polyprenyl-3-methyl-5-hydroxy-6-metoxy-1,4-benzoquinol methylase